MLSTIHARYVHSRYWCQDTRHQRLNPLLALLGSSRAGTKKQSTDQHVAHYGLTCSFFFSSAEDNSGVSVSNNAPPPPPHDYVSEVADWVVAFCCSILCIIVGTVIVLLVIALTFAIDSELNPDDPPDKQDDAGPSHGTFVSTSQIDPKDSPSPGSRPIDADNVAHDGDEGRLSPDWTPGFPVSASHPQVEEECSVDLQLGNKLDSKGSKEGVLQKSVDLVTGKICPENHACDSDTRSSLGSSVSSSQIDPKDSSSPGSRPVYADNVAHDGDEGRLSPGRTPGFPVSVSHPQVEEERSVDLQLGNKLDSKGSKEEVLQKSVDLVTGKICPENLARDSDTRSSLGSSVSTSQIDPKDSSSPGSHPIDADNVYHDCDEGCLSPSQTPGFPVSVSHPQVEEERSVDLQLGNKLDSKGSKEEALQKSVDHATGKIRPENHARDSDTRSSSGSSVSSSQIDPKDSPSPGSRPVYADNVAHDGDHHCQFRAIAQGNPWKTLNTGCGWEARNLLLCFGPPDRIFVSSRSTKFMSPHSCARLTIFATIASQIQ